MGRGNAKGNREREKRRVGECVKNKTTCQKINVQKTFLVYFSNEILVYFQQRPRTTRKASVKPLTGRKRDRDREREGESRKLWERRRLVRGKVCGVLFVISLTISAKQSTNKQTSGRIRQKWRRHVEFKNPRIQLRLKLPRLPNSTFKSLS